MTVETKYKIGDHHWLIDSNMVQKEEVYSIHITLEGPVGVVPYKKIEYKMNGGRYVSEENICPTKEELLKSL